jgi:hypothetical protein
MSKKSKSSQSSKSHPPSISRTDLILSNGCGLKDVAKRRIFEMLRSIGGDNRYMVMVVDRHALSVINSVCTMHDIMSEGVSLVEDLTKRREPIQRMDAIYLIQPTISSIQHVINDFDLTVDKNRKVKTYRSAHVISLTKISDELIHFIGNSPLATHIKTLKELNLDFLVNESQVFTTGHSFSARILYGSGLEDVSRRPMLLQECASMVNTLFISLGEKQPIIRHSNTELSKSFAELLISDNSYPPEAESLPLAAPSSSSSSYNPSSSDNRCQVLILDRSVDMVTPLLHQFTYEAMAYDLLGIDPETNTYKRICVNKNDQEYEDTSILDERDELWVTYRHGHLKDVAPLLRKHFGDFMDANKNLVNISNISKSETVLSMHDLRECVSKMPNYRDMSSKYGLHINIACACTDAMKQRNIIELSEFEEMCVIGKVSDSKKNPLKKLEVAMLSTKCREDRVRIIAIFVMMNGLSDEDRQFMYQRFEITHEERHVIETIFHIGKSGTGDCITNIRIPKSKKKEVRIIPPTIYRIVNELCTESLDVGQYPYVGNSSPVDITLSSPLKKGKWVKNIQKRRATQNNDVNSASFSDVPKLIIFVLGGITHSEMRSVYEASAKYRREIFIGSTHIITPKSYLESYTY